jgi:nicotinamidase-related amidase
MRALLVIDMLNDFLLADGKLPVGEAGRKIIPFIQEQVREFRKNRERIIFVCDSHSPDDAEFAMFPPHCVRGTGGSRVVDELAPSAEDIIIFKRRYSAFFATELDLALRDLGVTSLVLAGVCTNICVLYTAADARNLGYQVTVYRDGVASFSSEAHNFALGEMESVLGVTIR